MSTARWNMVVRVHLLGKAGSGVRTHLQQDCSEGVREGSQAVTGTHTGRVAVRETRRSHSIRKRFGDALPRGLRTEPPREIRSIREGATRTCDKPPRVNTAAEPDGRCNPQLYARALHEGASGRTVNMEVGELSRAIGKPWSVLWPKVRKLEERRDVGKALSLDEELALCRAITEQTSPNRSQTLRTFVQVALMTGMRSGEILGLTWGQTDLGKRVITVGRAKPYSGTGRQIPMNGDLFAVLSAHADWFTKRFGETRPEHYLFPFGKPTPSDPTKPITDITGAWDELRKRARVQRRLHDLRHTAATRVPKRGFPRARCSHSWAT